MLESYHSEERLAPSSQYDHHLSDDEGDVDEQYQSLDSTDERTEIILAATFLLIVVLAFLA